MQQPSRNLTTIEPGSEPFNRPPRLLASLPEESITIPTPPKKEERPAAPPSIMMIMPLMSIAALFIVYLIVYHGSATEMLFLLPMVVYSVMSPVGLLVSARQKIKTVEQNWKRDVNTYRQAIKDLFAHLTGVADKQRAISLSIDPDPDQLVERINKRERLWERRPDDPDFLSVRLGKGKRPLAVKLKLPDLDVINPLTKEVQQFERDIQTVSDIPCGVSLPKAKSLGITGKRQDVAGLIRGIVCQIAAHHSPEDVRIFGIYPVSQRHDWDWLAELPHTTPFRANKNQPQRLVAAGEEEANALLDFLLEELSQRASKDGEDGVLRKSSTSEQASPLPHLVVIVHDYVEVQKHPALTHAFKLGEQLGVSVIYMVAQQQAIPSECRAVVRLSDECLVSYAAAGYAGETFDEVYADIVELDMAQQVARALLPVHVPLEGEDEVNLPSNVRLLDLIDLPFADQFAPVKWWGNGSSPRFGRLRIPIGEGLNGTVWLDLSENAHGPHGIIAGTTGAGKSELLQSIIVGLAMTHHPHLVNFVLVDFKGGAAFKPFEKIPHTVGMVTDLSGHLTERALTALKSELRRREHVLSQANANKISEYQAMRIQNPAASMEPLPDLFIIIDEFAELAKEHPTFMEGLVSVVQKGRSLGVHLILATQKPTGSVNPNIWSNLKFRICLRVTALQDSRDMLGRSEAALLPSTIPGRAYFQIGSEIFEQFQSARISQTARVANELIITQKQAEMGASEVTDRKVLMDAIEPFTATIGAELFKPWPAPLPRRVSLTEVFKRLNVPRQAHQPPFGWLTVPVGMIDLPAEQRQEPWLLDMPRQGGHVLIAGASGTGKSVFLRTLIAGLIQTHSPAQLNLYLIDFGGQALRVFEKLPHTGGVFGESDEEYIRRLLRKLNGIIEERKQFFMTRQIDDFLTYQRKAEQAQLPELPAIVLVIDKFAEFRQAHDRDMDIFLSAARFGRNYGVYIVISLDRPVALSMQLLSLFEIRIGLRLVELTDSIILLGRQDAARIDAGIPGRGYKRGKILEEVQIALPVDSEDDDEQTNLLDSMTQSIASVSKEVRIRQAPPITLLPEYILADYFLMDSISHLQAQADPSSMLPAATGNLPGNPQATGAPSSSLSIRLGIEDFSLRPIDLELNSDTPHLLVGGGPGSGRTGVLHLCLLTLVAGLSPPPRPEANSATPEQAVARTAPRIILVDFRRTARLFRRLDSVWMYADTEDRLNEVVSTLITTLRERMAWLREALDNQQDDDDMPTIPDAPLVLVIDDYEQFSALTRNPLNDLKEFMLQARDLRFHIIVAGASSDLNKSDALLQQVRACRLGVVLGGDPQDQPLLGVRISDMPPGRGYLVKRNKRYLVQVAHLDPRTLTAWLARLRKMQPPSASKPPVVIVPVTDEQQLLQEAQAIVDGM